MSACRIIAFEASTSAAKNGNLAQMVSYWAGYLLVGLVVVVGIAGVLHGVAN